MRYIRTRVWTTLPQSRQVPARVSEPDDPIYQLDGSATHFGAAGCQVAGSQHITFCCVPSGMNGALLGLLAGGALMLVLMARSAFAFRVRR